MPVAGFALAQAGQALIRAMSKTANEGKGCACVAYLCAVLSIFTTLLPSCKLCSWLAFRAHGTHENRPATLTELRPPSLWKMFTAGRVPNSLSPRGRRQGA